MAEAKGGSKRLGGAAADTPPAKRTPSQSRAGAAADMLLRLGTASGEAAVQDSIARWLDENRIKYSPRYRTPAGTVDIHLEHRRVMMEVRRPARLDGGPMRGSGRGRGGREEPAYAQLGRCVDASRRQERLAGARLRWRGVVTDGRRWATPSTGSCVPLA